MKTKNNETSMSIEDRCKIMRHAVSDLVHAFNALMYLTIEEENGALSKSEPSTESEV